MKKHHISSVEKAREIFRAKGRLAYEAAKKAILAERLSYRPLREALTYFIGEIWRNYEHPALLALACESVGGDPESTTSIGAAFVLLTGAADLHDDVIDESTTKASKATVFGKYGRDTALLAGDALLVEGFALLYSACVELEREKARAVLSTVKDALFEVGNAEAEETSYRGKWDASPRVLLNVMQRKAALAEAATRIGATVGKGRAEQVAALGDYGRALALLANMRNEFVDICEAEEIIHRMKWECLPLPVLAAFHSKRNRRQIIALLKKKRFTTNDAREISRIATDTEEVIRLKRRMKHLAKQSLKKLELSTNEAAKENLNALLAATLEDL